ncbi:uncharacterized protein E0L32_005185 [Thyridium curvatum]|uniref:Centrosomin N-terminal motif 1 domain-containing protein n=1 Tax=Thyridium curvatum TaxID=1093900 RepID=A0A507BE38_9PEZI|nr:uncharacterized protein E0L32_005185 [Thyridium curvatum]TPX14790.1 hypothetical protein E0L32_005185 [Thyridium curvatum]
MPGDDSRPPPLQRSLRRVPGSFNDDEISPTKEEFGDISFPSTDNNNNNTTNNPPSTKDDAPSLPPPEPDSTFFGSPSFVGDNTVPALNEQAVRRHLQEDVESSFAVPISPIPTITREGVDDTFVFDSPKKTRTAQQPAAPELPTGIQTHDHYPKSTTPPSPAISDQRANLASRYLDPADVGNTTSSLEAFSSSPTPATGQRILSRTLSGTSTGRSDAGTESGQEMQEESMGEDSQAQSSSFLDSSSALNRYPSNTSSRKVSDAGSTPGNALKSGRRPKYLRSRTASQRSSVSSFVTNPESHDDVDSDVTVGMGADYALQSGGAAPSRTASGSMSNILSRSLSMGSMLSGMDEPRESIERLETLEEDDAGHRGDDYMRTPKAKGSLAAPTDTVIARRVMDVHVPESLAREYKTKGGLTTPRKPSEFSVTGTPRQGKSMTLKEQSSTIERLSKENFDLKLKVMFLSDRLDRLSEENVKEMISENVELKTGLAVLQRDNKVLRKRVKELEKQLKEEDERPSTAKSGTSSNGQTAESSDADAQDREEELIFLRERLEEYTTIVENLQADNLSKENEKRRMAEAIKSLQSVGEKQFGENYGRQEEVDVWKELYSQESVRREQADEENRKLRDEVFRYKQEMSSSAGPGGMHHTTNIYNITKKPRPSSPSRPVSAFSGETDAVNGGMSAASTLVDEVRRENEQLRHENSELRREVGAQTSMLTSRNREKERLYQEIEDLKLAQRRGGPAPSTIDSLFDRSASRAGVHERSGSRASGGTRAMTGIDESEREDLENKLAELRDKINDVKLQNQDLQRDLESCTQDFETAMEAKTQAEDTVFALQEELQAAENDLVALQNERDEALREYERLENEFQDLQKEAQEVVDTLENDVNARNEEIQHLERERDEKAENFDALQEEMRKLSEVVISLEDEQENKMRRIQQLEQELENANKELEELEGKLLESNEKANRLGVQQESSQSEIAFLREEQEADKIRIGDLEAALANTEQSLKEEKDRVKELEQRLANERRQYEIVSSREKEEVQHVVNELNREASTAKDEARKLRKSLTSREVEATEWKERLMELENNLREALGDLNGTRSSLLKVSHPGQGSLHESGDLVVTNTFQSIAKLQRELENTVRELENSKQSLMEKDRIIKQRDALLESHSLESRKVAEMLEKERLAHRQTRNQFETFQKTHQHVSRTVTSQDTRIVELESLRTQDKKRISQLETNLKEQLNERNNLLLVLWTRLSSLCGTDWAHDNSLINGRALPSLEAVATMLPGFSKNLMAAVKMIESIVGQFQSRIKGVEKDLWKEYQSLESHLEARTKKLNHLENLIRNGVATGTLGNGGGDRELQSRLVRIEEAYRQLKVENATLRTAQDVRHRAAYAASNDTGSEPDMIHGAGSPAPSIPTGPRDRGRGKDRSRSKNSSRVPISRSNTAPRPMTAGEMALAENQGPVPPAEPFNDSDKKWTMRLRDLELRLTKEREGRILDRNEFSRRLLEKEADEERERRSRRNNDGSG